MHEKELHETWRPHYENEGEAVFNPLQTPYFSEMLGTVQEPPVSREAHNELSRPSCEDVTIFQVLAMNSVQKFTISLLTHSILS